MSFDPMFANKLELEEKLQELRESHAELLAAIKSIVVAGVITVDTFQELGNLVAKAEKLK